MLGQPVSMLVPQVVGFKLVGALPRGGDRDRPGPDRHRDAPPQGRGRQVRRVLRRRPGQPAAGRPRDDRQHGPRVRRDLRHLPGRRRDAPLPRAHRPARAARSGWSRRTAGNRASSTRSGPPRRSTPTRSSSTWRPSSRAWPARSGRRTACRCARRRPSFAERAEGDARDPAGRAKATAARRHDGPPTDLKSESRLEGEGGGGTAVGVEDPTAPAAAYRPLRAGYITHGSVVIAAITSCTNTSNPSVMVAAGLLAKKAVERGLTTKPWVKTSLAPGSKVVTDYLKDAGLDAYLDQLRFHLVGYGCTTCIGNSGPLPLEISKAIHDDDLVAVAVLCGQPQLRGADQLRGPGQLPRLAAAGRRLRPGRHHGHRPARPSRSATTRAASRSTSRTSGRPSARSRTRS